MFRKKVWVFLVIWLMSVALLPAINLYKNPQQRSLSTLYNTDFFLPYVGMIAYKAGISTASNHTVLGKEGWFFLGDAYETAFSKKRHLSDEDATAIALAVQNAEVWQAWFQARGVQSYTIMLAPDKDSVYPEYLPDWAQASGTTPLQYFEQLNQAGIYQILLAPLLAAKTQFTEPLYYKTDSHWNYLGAWLGIKALAQHLKSRHPELQFELEHFVDSLYAYGHKEGDLANFQHIAHLLGDYFVNFKSLLDQPPVAERMNYATGELQSKGPITFADSQREPTLFTNPDALNPAKVLWISDSFGSNLVPFMLQHFSEVMYIHVLGAEPTYIAELTERFQPDYVITTVVEREARIRFYAQSPPD